jgi:hypothetical protein
VPDITATPTTPGRYRLSFLVGGLLAGPAAIAAPLYVEMGDWTAVRAALDAGNLLHARTLATAQRTGREVVQRMSTLMPDEVAYLATAPGTDRRHLMWVALARRYALVAEFADEVLRDRFLLGAGTLGPADFDRFWASKARWHDELTALRPSTRTKLRTNLFLAMREAGLLDTGGAIVSPLLSPRLTAFLGARSPSELRFFPIGGVR